MKLSKINEAPRYTTKLPSTGEKVIFRPFLVKEERALLTANESEDASSMFATLEQVVRNCLDNDIKKLTTFDMEFLFVTIRSKSVGETSDISIECECGVANGVTIDLKTVEVITSDNHTKKIKLGENHFALMKYPSVDDVLQLQSAKDMNSAKAALIKSCIETIVFGDDVYSMAEESDDELVAYLDTLTSVQYAQLQEFVDTIPYTQIRHRWECKSCKKKNETMLKGLISFF